MLVPVVVLAFGLFLALPAEDIPETAYDESVVSPCLMSSKNLPELLVRLGMRDKDLRPSPSTTPYILVRPRNLRHKRTVCRSLITSNQDLRC